MIYILKIKQWLSTVFYSQTDKQIKHQNSVFKQYLWSYVNYKQNNWILLLFLTKFVYNVNKHSAIQKISFEMIYKYILRFNLLTTNEIVQYTAKQESSAKTESLTDWLCTSCEEIQRFFIKTQEYQKKYYDKRWWNIMFKSEQKVWLYIKNIFIKKFLQKLDWLHYEFYKILKQIKNQVYKLELSKTLNIHNIFYVSLFKAHKFCEDEEFSELKSLHLVKNSNIYEYEISVILNLQIQIILNKQSMLQYQIAWKRYTDSIWKPKVNMKNVQRLINKFHKKNSDKFKSTSVKFTEIKVWLSFIFTLIHKDYLSLALHRNADFYKCFLLRMSTS